MSEPIGFGAMAIVLVLLAAIADHAIGWGTGVAVLLTAHSLWRQRRTEARVERRLAQVRLGPPQEPWPAYWPPEWRSHR
jgi:hypothetical protein